MPAFPLAHIGTLLTWTCYWELVSAQWAGTRRKGHGAYNQNINDDGKVEFKPACKVNIQGTFKCYQGSCCLLEIYVNQCKTLHILHQWYKKCIQHNQEQSQNDALKLSPTMNNQIPITDISPSPTPSGKQGRKQQNLYSEYATTTTRMERIQDLTLLAFSVPKTIVYKSQHISNSMANMLFFIIKKKKWA